MSSKEKWGLLFSFDHYHLNRYCDTDTAKTNCARPATNYAFLRLLDGSKRELTGAS